MKVLVTGGSGYIGHPVVEALQASGHQVRVFDRVPYEPQTDSARPLENFVGDLLDPANVEAALEGVDAVIHLAAFVRSGKVDEETAALLWRINDEATAQLLQAAKLSQVQRFIFASTCSIYPPTEPTAPADELTSPVPTTVYGETKHAAEKRVLSASGERFAPTVLRFATVYGDAPRISYEPLLNSFVRDAIVDGKMVVFAPQSWRPFIHVDDAARAVCLALDAPLHQVNGEIFNVGDEAQILEKGDAAALVKKMVPDADLILDRNRGDPRSYCVRFDKIRDQIGFRATVGLEEGVRSLVDRTRTDATLTTTERA